MNARMQSTIKPPSFVLGKNKNKIKSIFEFE